MVYRYRSIVLFCVIISSLLINEIIYNCGNKFVFDPSKFSIEMGIELKDVMNYIDVLTSKKLIRVEVLKNDKGIMEDVVVFDDFFSKLGLLTMEEVNKVSKSDGTVYFPDKVKMEESKDQNLVPKLDFGSVPTYKSETESGDNNDNENNNEEIEVATFNDNKEGVFQTKIDTEDMKFNKIDFTHEDSNFHKENQILSDQNECNSLKIASQKYV